MPSIPQYFASNELGTKVVVYDPERNLRVLLHDGTRHGLQSADAQRADEPLGYYHPSGPAGDIFRAAASASRVAVIGLGVGAMAAYARPGQHFVFYEIDPLVVRIAQDAELFTYLRRCRGTHEVVEGDGLEKLATDERLFDLVVIDAFISDEVPRRLLDLPACETYFERAERGGMLAFHVSNVRHDLEASLGAVARRLGAVSRFRADLSVSDEQQQLGKQPSQYMVMARAEEDLGPLADDPLWKRPAG